MGSRTIGPSLRASDSVRVAVIPPDFLLQRPNHPKHECQRQAHRNEKQLEIEIDHEDALRCRIQKLRQEAAGRASEWKILLPHGRPPHVWMEQSTCKDFVRGRKEANAPPARRRDATADQSQNIKTVPMMMSSRSSRTQATNPAFLRSGRVTANAEVAPKMGLRPDCRPITRNRSVVS